MTVGSSLGRTFNLRMHTRSHITSDIVVGTKELKPGALIEIRHTDAPVDATWTAFEVGGCRDDIPKDVISFEQSLASQLRLKPHGEIVVRPTSKSEHVVSLAELLIKDQYLSQADLWLLGTYLSGSCVHVGKLIEFHGMRATIKLLWRQGDSRLSGYVSPDHHETKIVFRSATASMNIFILMTREMWQFDLSGDLCFQLVVCGLLTDLFSAWRQRACTHDVTIALGTRVIYDANSIDNFPEDMRKTIQQNSKKQFFEDVYDVIVQNERFDDWSDTLMSLNKAFIKFDKNVLRHGRNDLPKRRIAFSAEAPILEGINMVLNAMDTYRSDHRFDRIGNSLVLIVASQGVYDVEKRLKSMTKKRVTESGLAVDLVCVLPQPFHTVPLFRMFDESSYNENVNYLTFEYSNPSDWINVSFYQPSYSNITLTSVDNLNNFDSNDKRAIAYFDVDNSDNFANLHLVAKLDTPMCDSGVTKFQKILLNPFSSSNAGTDNRGRASRTHANRWLHALPLDERGQPLQIHHYRYRSPMETSRRRRPTASAEISNQVLTGVDWKSLILPAILPCTAAAGFGLNAWLKEACVESPHDVPFSLKNIPSDEKNEEKDDLFTVGFKRPQTPQDVFDLLILLRLVAGFQLVIASQNMDSNPKEQASSFFKIQKTPSVLMASGRYYQKLELIEAEQRVLVTKFVRLKPGAAHNHLKTSIHPYPFLFRVPDTEKFSFASTEFTNRRPDLLNLWAPLDYHVSQKTWDIDINDYSIRECFWKSRFTALPLINLPSSSTGKKNIHNEIDWFALMEEVMTTNTQYSSLSRFIGYINGFSSSRPISQSTPTLTPIENQEKSLLSQISNLQQCLDNLGLSYVESSAIQSQQGQPCRFYTAYDTVNYMISEPMSRLFGVDSIDAAIDLLNEWIANGRIYAPRGSGKLCYGIFYFSFVPHRNIDLVEVSFNDNDDLPAENTLMLNVDSRDKDAGHELAMIVYDSHFHPGCAFQLRLEWLFASGSFLCELVDSWHHRARSWGTHFLPIPSNPFDMTALDPLRLIIELPYQPENAIRAIKGHHDVDNMDECISTVTRLIFHHFAFIQTRRSNTSTFMHMSGAAFVRHRPGKIHWAWNFQLSKKWQTVLENEAGDTLLADFRRVSSNSDNSLVNLVKAKGVLSDL